MTDKKYPLEWSGEEMRVAVDAAMERIARHIDSLPEQPAAYDLDGDKIAPLLAESMPEQGVPLNEALGIVFDKAVPHSFNTAGPGYLAYVPGGGVPAASVGSLIADSVNRYVGVWLAAPGLVQLEVNVIRWFCSAVGYGEGSGGVLTTGGSMANLIATVTARRERLPENFLDGTLYTSEQAHHSVTRAAVLAGFPEKNVKAVPSDSLFRMEMDRLESMIRDDRARGKTPFMLIASAGTTNTGAVDDLTRAADIAEREKMWLHTDAAYGGFFCLTERGREALKGLERADSMSLDPHKGLFMPYGVGSLLVKEAKALERAHATFADYMPAMQDHPDFVDFCQISPELSREFRGLKVWLPLKLFGMDAFRQSLDEKLDLANWATERLKEIPDIEILARPQLSIVAFRLKPDGVAEADLNELNRQFMKRVNSRNRVYLTGTMLGGRFAVRICVLSFRTHMDRMEACLEDIRSAL